MLEADLRVSADIDLGDLFVSLSAELTGADFGDVRFDASGIMTLVERAAPPDVAQVLSLASAASARLEGRVAAGLPGADLPGAIRRATDLLGQLSDPGALLLPDVPIGVEAGLEALAGRSDLVVSAVESGPLAALLGLVPDLPMARIGEVGGALGGIIEALKVLAALGATSAVSTRLVEQADLLAGRLDVAAAEAAAARLAEAMAVTGLAADLAAADPADSEALEVLGARVVTFLDAVVELERCWSHGMGFGEAALLGLDLTGGAAALEVARLALGSADLEKVTATATMIRGLADPLLQLPLPVPEDATRDVIDQAMSLVGGLTATIEAWDPDSVTSPLSRFADLLLGPIDEVRRLIETVSAGIVSAVRALRELVDEVDLTAVADSVRSALAPIVDTFEAVGDAIAVAEQTIVDTCEAIEGTLTRISDAVRSTAGEVTAALGRVREALEAVDVADVAAAVRTEIDTVVAALSTAQLTPYFNSAIDVIDTGTQVIDAVPFELLPTDVQQEIVDVARPIKELDLQSVEDTLREELAAIRDSLHTDVLDAIGEASRAVVEFLASLDPEPLLVELEAGPLQQLKAAVDAIDPQTLLAPAQEALQSMRGALAGIDLREEVLAPLNGLFTPVLDALDEIDPTELMAPLDEALATVRSTVTDVLQLEAVEQHVQAFRTGAQAFLLRIDPAALVSVLDEAVAERIAELPAGPPGGPFGSLLVTLGQAGGLDVDEPAIADALAWLAGRADGAGVVRGRLQHLAAQVDGVRVAVGRLDPAPMTAAAQAHHRSLVSALANHPADSPLRQALDPLLAAVVPVDVLGPLTENRRRYLAALAVSADTAQGLAASARTEVTVSASGLNVALLPLAALPARARELLSALGLAGDASWPDLFAELYRVAGPARVVPALTALIQAATAKLVVLLDAVTDPALDAIGRVEAALDALDVRPIVTELEALHGQVVADIQAVSPENLLGDVLDEADQTLAELADFDPLAPVEDAVTAAKQAATSILESARPTVVFADVVTMHHDLVALAGGLDVEALVMPVITALDAIGGQLDDGFDRTGDALQRLQAALPDQVSGSGASLSGSVSISGSLG